MERTIEMELPPIPTPEDSRVLLFAVVLAAGFLAVTGGVSAILGESVGIGVWLAVVGAVAMVSAVVIATGRYDPALFGVDRQ